MTLHRRQTVRGYRKPPLPKSYTEPPVKGFCRWCGKPVSESGRYYWHKACQDEYRAVTSNESARSQLVKRYGNACAICGIPAHEVDHIVPLASCPRELKYWTLANMQLLCRDCHRFKTLLDSRAAKTPKPDPPPLEAVPVAELEPLFNQERK